MTAPRNPTPRRTLLVFFCAIAGSVTGILAGPRLVAAAEGAPPWLLPLVMAVSVLLALVGAYIGVRVAMRNASVRPPVDRGGT